MNKKVIILIIVVLLILGIVGTLVIYVNRGNQGTTNICTWDKTVNLCAYFGDTYYYFDNNKEKAGIYALYADGSENIIYECENIYCIDADNDTVCFAADDLIIIINVSTYAIETVELDFVPYEIKIDNSNIFAACFDDIYMLSMDTNEMEKIHIVKDEYVCSFYSSHVDGLYPEDIDMNVNIYVDENYCYVSVADSETQDISGETTEIQKGSIFNRETGERIVGNLFDFIYDNMLIAVGGNYVEITDMDTFDAQDISLESVDAAIVMTYLCDDKIVLSHQKTTTGSAENKAVRNIKANYITLLSLNDFSYNVIEYEADDIIVSLYDDSALLYKWKEHKYYLYDYDSGDRTFVSDDMVIDEGSFYYMQSCGQKIFIYNDKYELLDVIEIS